jgi:hypothetical protein
VYAQKHALRVEAPVFPGQECLPFRFAQLSNKLPDMHERMVNPYENSEQLPPVGEEFVNRDFCGYAQYRTNWYAPYKNTIRRMWTPTLTYDEGVLQHAMEGYTCIGLHYRAGDYVTLGNNDIFWRPPKRWYREWLANNWGRFKNPKLFVATEDPQQLEWFRDYNPATAESIGLTGYFVADWAVLSYCDVLLAPNSTFAFTAAMANCDLREAWRATLPAAGFELFDPWNDVALRYEKGRNYPHLELDRKD